MYISYYERFSVWSSIIIIIASRDIVIYLKGSKVWTVGFTAIKPKGQIQMIDAMYNYRQDEIHSAEFSDDFNKLCIPFEDSLSVEQIDVFHKILDCVSENAPLI